jgi:hypothetical protein
MFVIEAVGDREQFLVPAVVSGFISADQQNCTTPRIKRKKHSIRPACVLRPELFPIGMERGMNQVDVWPSKRRAAFREEPDIGINAMQLGFGLGVPPALEFGCEFERPFHRKNITSKE